jgi:hypothetical protein
MIESRGLAEIFPVLALSRVKQFVRFVEMRSPLFLAAFSVGYLALMYWLSAGKALWIDEYLTLYIARLPISEIPKALLTGAESHPPSFLYLTHAALSLFGMGPFALRLLAILGFLLMELCLFQFVRKRTSVLLAFTATLVPFTTRGVYYAIEARGYGLLLGLTALSLVCWSEAADGKRRKLAIAGLAASLAAATATHYFGVIIVLPLALGEMVRSLSNRRVDAWIWAAFTTPALPLLLFAPMIRASRAYTANHGLLNSKFDYFSYVLFHGHALLLILLLAITVPAILRRGKLAPAGLDNRPAFPLHEVGAMIGFLFLPVAAYVATRVAQMPFADRYVLSAVIAVSVFVALTIHAMPGREVVAATVVAGFFVWAAGNFLLRSGGRKPASIPEGTFLQTRTKGGLPIVVSDMNSFLHLSATAPEDVARRIVYLVNADAALHYLGSNTADRILLDLRPWIPAQIEPYCEYRAKTHEFHVFGSLDVDTNWLSQDLADAKSEVVGINAGRLLLLVRPPVPSRFCPVGGVPLQGVP